MKRKVAGAEAQPAVPKQTAGVWNRDVGPLYFLVAHCDQGSHLDEHPFLLQEAGVLVSPARKADLHDWLDRGATVLLDSGVFVLAGEHATAHGLTLNEALALPPETLDGWTELFDLYVALVREFAPRLWGYIELDLGGPEHKRRLRNLLETRYSFAPIPVFHPLSDPPEYLDELASSYDRICFGNIARSTRAIRMRIAMLAWQTKCRYPHLWVHLLGLSPNEWASAMPWDSGDSVGWLSSVRFGGCLPRALGATMGKMPRNYQYELVGTSGDNASYIEGRRMAVYEAGLGVRSLAHYRERLIERGADLWPPLGGK